MYIIFVDVIQVVIPTDVVEKIINKIEDPKPPSTNSLTIPLIKEVFNLILDFLKLEDSLSEYRFANILGYPQIQIANNFNKKISSFIFSKSKISYLIIFNRNFIIAFEWGRALNSTDDRWHNRNQDAGKKPSFYLNTGFTF